MKYILNKLAYVGLIFTCIQSYAMNRDPILENPKNQHETLLESSADSPETNLKSTEIEPITEEISLTEKIYRVSGSDGFTNEIFSISVIKIDKSYGIDIYASLEGESAETTSIKKLSSCRLLAMISGGFIDRYDPFQASGYLKTKAEQETRYSARSISEDPVLSGLFCVSDNKPIILSNIGNNTIEEIQINAENYEACIQAGPILAVNGEELIDAQLQLRSEKVHTLRRYVKERYVRSFAYIDEHDHLSFGISTPVSLIDLSRILIKSKDQGGLGAIHAISLHGASNAVVLARNKSNYIFGQGNRYAKQSSFITACKK